jgi:hypothetical protein
MPETVVKRLLPSVADRFRYRIQGGAGRGIATAIAQNLGDMQLKRFGTIPNRRRTLLTGGADSDSVAGSIGDRPKKVFQAGRGA